MTLPTVFKFEPMNEANARAVQSWRYEAPYDFYNPTSDTLAAFLDPLYHYYSVMDERGELIAFRCFGADAQVPGGDYSADALDMGGGLRPDLTGQGLGPRVMNAAIEFARIQFAPRVFRTTVAAFNRRALRACEKVGYEPVQSFIATHNGMPFVVLMRMA